jgi:hypothetical protein
VSARSGRASRDASHQLLSRAAPGQCDRSLCKPHSLPPSPIQERQQGSGDPDEIRKTEHALLDLSRHRAQLLQENTAREPAREAPHRPDEPQGEDEVPVEVMRYDGDDADEPLDKAGLYLHVRDSLDRGMLETEEGDQDDADASTEKPGICAGRERRGLEGALREALR